jgi:hypothetical protein
VLSLRLKLRLVGIQLQGNPDDYVPLTVVSPRRISVLVERAEIHGLDPQGGAVAVARTQLEPNDAVARGFAALADFRLPEGTPQASLLNWRRYQDASGRLKPGMVYPQSSLPPAMSSFIEQMRKDLVQAISRSCLALRWRYALPGPHNPLRAMSAGPEWSVDGSSWHLLPANSDLRTHLAPEVYPTDSVTAAVQTLLDAGHDEPIAHQIFREALENRAANRRSALVMAVAALEVGIKTFVGQWDPSASWLITHMPSPLIRRILAEYLPSLEAPATRNERVSAPPKAVLDLIDKAVSFRDRVAHPLGDDIPHETVEEMLTAIGDVLWMLDFHGGAEWAASHISAPTRAALGLLSSEEV